MKKELHQKQKAILEVLKRGEEGLSLRDIAEEIGVNSPNTVLYHMNQLEKKGYLRRDPVNPANYIILKDPIKDITYVNLYGMAQCGPEGLLAEENIIDRIPLSTKTFGVSDQVFLVKARGDSMEPLIFENDLVLAFKQPDLETGEIGVVVHNDEPKIKKIIKIGKKYVLESLNSRYFPEEIKSEDSFQIIGKVKNIIHFANRKRGRK
ncbi:winged helix-turn-helix transcriptional regulator [bacterium]|nr:winged helix-turn-helix transcriptional regulator [bacterium]